MRADLFVLQVIFACVVLAYSLVWCKRELGSDVRYGEGTAEHAAVDEPPLPPPPQSPVFAIDPPEAIVLWETAPVSADEATAAAATARVNEFGGQLTADELTAILRLAGWPDSLIPEAMAVSWCESRWSPYAIGDGGQSLGLFQLWTGWFPAFQVDLSAWYDPLVNARVARQVYERRGRWGGGGGWSCAP